MPIIKYNFKGEIIDSNVLGNTPQELAAGFGLISDLNPRVTNKIKHIAISFAREDLGKLDEKQMVLLGHEYLVKMGYGNCPYTMFYLSLIHI